MVDIILAGRRSLLAPTLVVMACFFGLVSGCMDSGRDIPLPTEPEVQGCPPVPLDSTVIQTTGLRGIVLTPGPGLIFQIDRQRTEKPLFWDDWVKRFPKGYVELTVEVLSNGEIAKKEVSREYEMDPAAFNAIWDAVRTWTFEGDCLEGELSYAFNASASEVVIDASAMLPVEGYEQCEIIRGCLHRVWRRDRQYRFWPHPGRI